MCGIGGVVLRQTQLDIEMLHRAKRHLAQRGPDGSGIWIHPAKPIGFVHTRLSIIDLSDAAAQPMQSRCGRYTIIFNGEIYNFRELRKAFEREGALFGTNSDTEVLLEAWVRYGIKAVDHLRGMYAFAVWDDRDASLHLVRDPLGIKPLYFSSDSGGIYFASEPVVLREMLPSTTLSLIALGAFLKTGSVPSPHSMYAEIQQLGPGWFIRYDFGSGTSDHGCYWDYGEILVRTAHLEKTRDIEWVRQLLLDSVAHHLVADVEVGAFLSGGIDSTSVVSLMRQAGVQAISTFSVAFEESELDESSYARAAAKRFETTHHEWVFTRDDFAGVRGQFLNDLRHPSVDGLNTWVISRFAREKGIKVVTSGIGGDEFFHGYDLTFRHAVTLSQFLGKLPLSIKRLLANFLKPMEAFSPTSGVAVKLRQLLGEAASLRDTYSVVRQLFSDNMIRGLFRDRDIADGVLNFNASQHLPALRQRIEPREEIGLLEVYRFLGPQLLADADFYSMANSLELRTPLVDRTLAEGLAHVDPSLFRGDGKTPKPLLVGAVGDLPDRIVNRKKYGFTFPLGKWLRTYPLELDDGIFDVNFCRKLNKQFMDGKLHWSRRWALEVLNSFLVQKC